jgi:hypothetical protein
MDTTTTTNNNNNNSNNKDHNNDDLDEDEEGLLQPVFSSPNYKEIFRQLFMLLARVREM